MTILEGKIKGWYFVTDVLAEEAVTRRLEALGINEGTKVELMNRKKNGTSIIKVRGTRWAVGRDIAQSIRIEPVPEEKSDEEN